MMPQELWPKIGEQGHGVVRWRETDTYELLLHAHARPGYIPLHIHQADRFYLVVKGTLTVISQKSCVTLEPGASVIIRAGQSHGFMMPEEVVRYITISMGPGHAAPNLLPAHIQKIFASMAHDPSTLRTFTHTHQWNDPYSEIEHHTIEWVRSSLLAPVPSPFVFEQRELQTFPMRGWQVGEHTWIIKVRHRAVSLTYEEPEGVPRLRVREVFAFSPGLDRKDPRITILK